MKTFFVQNRIAIIAALLLMVFSQTNAQTGTTAIIKGFVYDKASGEPVIFTNVLLEGTKIGVQTDVNGYFTFTQLKPGTYTLMTSLIGYDTVKSTVVLKAGDVITKKLFLGQRRQELTSVEVSARKTEKVTQINAGSITVTPREMKLLPSAGGEPDIAQYLQVVPGVVFTGDQGGQLYIRGGAPSQTGILLDGITIYNPFHSIGLYSVFETDAIRNVEVQTAGFNAQYGNRTSAILDVRTKDGNKNRLSGKVSASPIMARAMLEGPLIKSKTEGGPSTTFLLSIKHSYLNSTSKSLYSGFGEPFNNGLPYSFTDLYGKITFNGDNGSKLNLFGFNFDDKASVFKPGTSDANADFHWKASGVGASFVVTPGTSAALINGRFAYSRYNIDYTNFNDIPVTPQQSGIDGFEGAIDFTYYFKGYSQLKYGIEVSGFHTNLNFRDNTGSTTTLDRRNTLAALYVLYRKNFNEKLVFEPSFRLQYYAGLSKASPEPRLGLKYNVTSTVRLKAATGMYSQNIISTKSDRDIVNFFTGFILSPDQQIVNTDQQVVANNLQTAYHVLGGIEVDVRNVEFNLEPWYKNFTQSVELSRIKYNSSDPDFIAGNGKAYGVDLSAKYSKGRWYLWGVVSLQQVKYETLVLKNNKVSADTSNPTKLVAETQKQEYAPPFDRRLNINLLASYTFGKKRDIEVSGRFNYGSAFPFTQTQGFYENLSPTANSTSTNINQQNGTIGILYANDINGGRLSPYHRLDVSVKKRFTLSKYSNIETQLSITNVYNRNNIFYVDRKDNIRVYQLPVFPSIGATWNF
ncbi:MAG TPA: TonB-dependent receptor [Flavipsychrobacter sp.]|nr:TonB-dependent receptor [Flavipsychrobacter sp.]